MFGLFSDLFQDTTIVKIPMPFKVDECWWGIEAEVQYQVREEKEED